MRVEKKSSRLRRARRARNRISRLGIHRLSVHRTASHIYAQVFAPDGSEVVASASTLDAEFKKRFGSGGNQAAAAEVGRAVAERAKKAGVTRVAFDRSGFKYHGRVKALADGAREGGLQF